MTERAIDMSSALNSTEQLQAEVQKLRRQVSEAEDKSQRAEAALKATEQRYRLLGDSALLGVKANGKSAIGWADLLV